MGLLGKDFSQILPEADSLNMGLLYDINMGYEKRQAPSLAQSIRWNQVETEFQHPWSVENLGRQYAQGKLEDFISIDEYLNLPACVVGPFITGMMKGKEARYQAEKKAREEADNKARNAPPKHTGNIDGRSFSELEAELAGLNFPTENQ